MVPRRVFSAVLYILRTGCPWKQLPHRIGCASTVHRHFVEWEQKGFFQALWQAGLAEHEDLEGIPWEWQGTDLIDSFGCGPVDREQTWTQPISGGQRAWRPVVPRRQRG